MIENLHGLNEIHPGLNEMVHVLSKNSMIKLCLSAKLSGLKENLQWFKQKMSGFRDKL